MDGLINQDQNNKTLQELQKEREQQQQKLSDQKSDESDKMIKIRNDINKNSELISKQIRQCNSICYTDLKANDQQEDLIISDGEFLIKTNLKDNKKEIQCKNIIIQKIIILHNYENKLDYIIIILGENSKISFYDSTLNKINDIYLDQKKLSIETILSKHQLDKDILDILCYSQYQIEKKYQLIIAGKSQIICFNLTLKQENNEKQQITITKDISIDTKNQIRYLDIFIYQNDRYLATIDVKNIFSVYKLFNESKKQIYNIALSQFCKICVLNNKQGLQNDYNTYIAIQNDKQLFINKYLLKNINGKQQFEIDVIGKPLNLGQQLCKSNNPQIIYCSENNLLICKQGNATYVVKFDHFSTLKIIYIIQGDFIVQQIFQEQERNYLIMQTQLYLIMWNQLTRELYRYPLTINSEVQVNNANNKYTQLLKIQEDSKNNQQELIDLINLDTEIQHCSSMCELDNRQIYANNNIEEKEYWITDNDNKYLFKCQQQIKKLLVQKINNNQLLIKQIYIVLMNDQFVYFYYELDNKKIQIQKQFEDKFNAKIQDILFVQHDPENLQNFKLIVAINQKIIICQVQITNNNNIQFPKENQKIYENLHTGYIRKLCISNDKIYIASSGDDGQVWIYKISEKQDYYQIQNINKNKKEQKIGRICFLDDDEFIYEQQGLNQLVHYNYKDRQIGTEQFLIEQQVNQQQGSQEQVNQQQGSQEQVNQQQGSQQQGSQQQVNQQQANQQQGNQQQVNQEQGNQQQGSQQQVNQQQVNQQQGNQQQVNQEQGNQQQGSQQQVNQQQGSQQQVNQQQGSQEQVNQQQGNQEQVNQQQGNQEQVNQQQANQQQANQQQGNQQQGNQEQGNQQQGNQEQGNQEQVNQQQGNQEQVNQQQANQQQGNQQQGNQEQGNQEQVNQQQGSQEQGNQEQVNQQQVSQEQVSQQQVSQEQGSQKQGSQYQQRKLIINIECCSISDTPIIFRKENDNKQILIYNQGYEVIWFERKQSFTSFKIQYKFYGDFQVMYFKLNHELIVWDNYDKKIKKTNMNVGIAKKIKEEKKKWNNRNNSNSSDNSHNRNNCNNNNNSNYQLI